jgi:hypothetical protein
MDAFLGTPVGRRSLLGFGLALLAPGALRAAPAGGRLAFAVYRNGTQIGEHRMSFVGDPGAQVITTDVAMTVKLGPVPIYRYRHRAVERWAGGSFAALESATDGNGKRQSVNATRTASAVMIETTKGEITAPANALPLTHWNPQAMAGPLFNPQEGKMLHVTAARGGRETIVLADGRSVQATCWSLRGEAEIDDFYDPSGTWVGLRGKLADHSRVEYRRL